MPTWHKRMHPIAIATTNMHRHCQLNEDKYRGATVTRGLLYAAGNCCPTFTMWQLFLPLVCSNTVWFGTFVRGILFIL